MSIVHIPLAQYHQYLQSILKLLFPAGADEAHPDNEPGEDFHPQVSWANRHAFLNVSVTPIECSIVCSKDLALEVFASILPQNHLASDPSPKTATISSEDFVVISVEGEGLEAGQRVLELTSPLALAGMLVDSNPLHALKSLSDKSQFNFLHHDLLFGLYFGACQIPRSGNSRS